MANPMADRWTGADPSWESAYVGSKACCSPFTSHGPGAPGPDQGRLEDTVCLSVDPSRFESRRKDAGFGRRYLGAQVGREWFEQVVVQLVRIPTHGRGRAPGPERRGHPRGVLNCHRVPIVKPRTPIAKAITGVQIPGTIL